MASGLDDSFTENTFGDLSYTFLEPVPNYLTCIICYGLLKEPVATDCCEKMFCNEHSSRTDRVCPACRHAPLSVSRNRGFDSIVKDLKVFCLNHKEGCPWSGHLCYEPNHRVVTCDYQSVPCAKQCGVQVARRLMANHLTKECLLREIECGFCDYKGTTAEVKFHLETCPEYRVACPHGCEVQLSRKDLNGHSSTCSEAPVPCPFANAGCDMVPVKRKDLAGHLETSVGAHLLLLASDNQRLSEEVVELRKERKERLERERAEMAELEKVKAELQQLRDKIDKLVENDITKGGIGRVNADIYNTAEAEMALSTSTNEESEEELYDSEESCSVDGEWMDELNDLSDESFLPVVLRYEGVQFDMTMDGTWISPQFYDNNGYCMSVCVTPNGLNQAKGKFVSVQLQLQYGVNGGELYWPYNDSLDVDILNPRADHSHLRKTVNFSSFPNRCVMQPDVFGENEPWGVLRFLNQNELHDYLRDDTLYLRIKHIYQ